MMKFDYENHELAIYEDKEEINGMDCLIIWQTKDGICVQLGEDYTFSPKTDAYGGTFYIVKKTKGGK